jgi:hypothetical protein
MHGCSNLATDRVSTRGAANGRILIAVLGNGQQNEGSQNGSRHAEPAAPRLREPGWRLC